MQGTGRPSPATLIACTALVLALAGTAVAVPPGNERSISKAKVKRIADKRIAKAAPGLSVGNAEALGGRPPADFASSQSEPYHEVGSAGEPGFQNGWGNFGGGFSTGAFYKDPLGVVHLKGMIDTGTGTGQTAFTLPAGYRPAQILNLPTSSAANVAAVHVEPDGEVKPGCGANPCTPRLDGLTFRADG